VVVVAVDEEVVVEVVLVVVVDVVGRFHVVDRVVDLALDVLSG
jgi:hypothetical protein